MRLFWHFRTVLRRQTVRRVMAQPPVSSSAPMASWLPRGTRLGMASSAWQKIPLARHAAFLGSPPLAAERHARGATESSPALSIGRGGIRVVVWGIGTSTPAFVHVATAANSGANWTLVDNPLCNGDPNAILIVTPRLISPNNVFDTHPIGVWFDTARGKWQIFHQDATAVPVNDAFNVLVITS